MDKKVLIVEDDKFLRETLAKKFVAQGLTQIQAAVDGKNALEILKTFTPDLVILDLLLPDIDGFGVLTEMKKDPKFASVPVIVLSNLDKPDDMVKAKGLGAKDFMVKSNFTLNEIISRAKATLGIQ